MSEQTLLILGASGDLTARLLLPGLGGLLAGGGAEGLALIGSGMDDWDDAGWRERVEHSFGTANESGPAVDAVLEGTRYLKADVTREDDLKQLLDACEGQLTIYFALAPSITRRSCEALTKLGLPEGARLVMEKPFGTDAESAEQLNALLAKLVPEDHVFRVDHFLGMSTVLNILGLRFANRILEPVLNAEHVEEVEVVFDEVLGLEGRAGYYDGAGALVDMLQSHLLQVLALLAMDPPPALSSRELRDGKAQVLRATHVWDDDPVRSSRRARYTEGEVEGRRLPAYADEEGIDPERKTETLAEVVFAVDTWRWAGVPFRLRSGKALYPQRTEAVITFKQPQRLPAGFAGHSEPNRLTIEIGPGPSRLRMDMTINGPGDPFDLDPAVLEADFGAGELPEYGEVLKAALNGDPSLSVRGDTAVECWRIIEPVQKAWRADEVPLEEYPAGSSGLSG